MCKSLRFKEKEESNTDFSLVKGALTENINRLEKLMNNSSSKYMLERTKRKCIEHFLLFLFNSKLIFYFSGKSAF